MYLCRDCNYKGKKIIEGSCPACGSRNISALKKTTPAVTQEKSHPLKKVLLLLLWGFLFFKLYQHFFA